MRSAAAIATVGLDVPFLGVNDMAGSIGLLERLDQAPVRALATEAATGMGATGKPMGTVPSAGASLADLYGWLSLRRLPATSACCATAPWQRCRPLPGSGPAMPAHRRPKARLMAEALLAALRDALGENAVASGAEVPERNRNDWSPLPPVTPLAVVRPSTPEGVATAM